MSLPTTDIAAPEMAGTLVGTPRCGVHARQGGMHREGSARVLGGLFPSPDAAPGDGDIAARCPYHDPTTDGAARRPYLTSAATMIFNESGVGRAARATAAAVCSSGKAWVINCRTSRRREKTSRAASDCRVKSDE